MLTHCKWQTHNFIEGDVPCFENAPLEVIFLDSNLLTGTVPACLLNKPYIEQIHLSTNFLRGTIPEGWGMSRDPGAACPGQSGCSLLSVKIANANLEGTLPSLCQDEACESVLMPRIAIFDLSQNHLAGPLPPSIMQVRRRICSLYQRHW